MSKLEILSNHAPDRVKFTPLNLLDELADQIRSGEIDVTDLMVVHTNEEGNLTVVSTDMPRYKAVGLLTFAAHLEVVDVG